MQDETVSLEGSNEELNEVEQLKPLKSIQDIKENWVADHAKHVSIRLSCIYKP